MTQIQWLALFSAPATYHVPCDVAGFNTWDVFSRRIFCGARQGAGHFCMTGVIILFPRRVNRQSEP